MIPDRELEPKERKCPECGGSLEEVQVCKLTGEDIGDCNTCPDMDLCEGLKDITRCIKCDFWQTI